MEKNSFQVIYIDDDEFMLKAVGCYLIVSNPTGRLR